jgi:hypothetical protein
MFLQERYWSQWDKKKGFDQYPHTWEGIGSFIDDTLTDPKQNEVAHKRVEQCQKMRAKAERTGRSKAFGGGFPILYMFQQIANGAHKRAIGPINPSNITKAMLSYENE